MDANVNASSTTGAPGEGGGGKGKTIGLFFLVLVLLVGSGVGVYLVQRQQDIRNLASSGKECTQAPDCDHLDSPGNQGSHTAPGPIVRVNITDQDIHTYLPEGNTNDGCRSVTIIGNNVTWERFGSGRDCKDVSNVQVWWTQSTATPTPTLPPTDTPTTPPGSATSAPTKSPTLPPSE